MSMTRGSTHVANDAPPQVSRSAPVESNVATLYRGLSVLWGRVRALEEPAVTPPRVRKKAAATSWNDIEGRPTAWLYTGIGNVPGERLLGRGLSTTGACEAIEVSSSMGLSIDWDSEALDIGATDDVLTFARAVLNVATGTAPLTITSTTLVANLNADLLDGQEGAYYLDSDNFTGTEWTDLTDAGETALHIHDDRYYTESEVDALTWDASDIVSGTFDDARISQSSVTQHQAALSIADTQLTGTNWTDLTDGGETTLHIHDGRYYTETELDAGQLDTRYYTESETDTLLLAKSDTSHRHDGETLQHDAVNSDGGAFSFTTSGQVTFSNTLRALRAGFGVDPHTTIPLYTTAAGYTDAQFGSTTPVYVMHYGPRIGLNCYYDSGYKYGAGSSSNYAGYLDFGISDGSLAYYTTAATGNAAAAAAMAPVYKVSRAGVVTTGDGAVGAPGWSFTGDTNTGIYRVGADSLGIATGGTARLLVNTDVYTDSWQAYSPTVTGWSGTPTTSFKYKRIGKLYFVEYSISGTGNTDATEFTLPESVDATAVFDRIGTSGHYPAGSSTVPIQGFLKGDSSDAKVVVLLDTNGAGTTGAVYGNGNTKWLCGHFWFQSS